jgi:hypothetical protein
MVADVFEDWINIADVDGFNVAYLSNPGSFEDVVELLVPELQKRGLMQEEYAVPGGTLRENLLRQPGQKHLRDDHYGAAFAWEKNHDKNGKEIVTEKVVVAEKETPQVMEKKETDTVQQQLAELTKTLAEFATQQAKVNDEFSARLEKLTPATNGIH